MKYRLYYMENTFLSFQSLRNANIKNEVLAGLTVAMTMIPESLSFAILAGLSPLTGLYWGQSTKSIKNRVNNFIYSLKHL